MGTIDLDRLDAEPFASGRPDPLRVDRAIVAAIRGATTRMGSGRRQWTASFS
jgi:hypothetical protein